MAGETPVELPISQEANTEDTVPPAQKLQQFFSQYFNHSLSILSHILFGLHPVFSRYLQYSMPNPLPVLSLITVGFGSVFLLYLPKTIYQVTRFTSQKLKNEKLNKEFVQRIARLFWTDFILNWRLWIYIGSVLSRSLTNIYSSRLTSAIYVQLIALTSPFMVSAISWIFLRNTPEGRADRLTIRTFLAMVTTIVGSAFIILGGIHSEGESGVAWRYFITNFKIEFRTLGSDISTRDFMGMACALLANLCLAVYMIMVKTLKKANANSASKFLTEGSGMLLFQTTSTSLFFMGPSLIFENWTPWLLMRVQDWCMLAAFIILVLLVAMLTSIFAIQRLGATTVGATVPIRLVSTIVFSLIILGETLQSVWQILGALIVLVSVTLFLYWQNEQHKAFAKEQEQLATVVVNPEVPPIEEIVPENKEPPALDQVTG